MLIHLRPQSYLVECAIQADLVLGPLDEHEVAVTRATDAFVADRFAGNLHWPERRGFEGGRVRATLTLQSMRRVGKSTGHTLGTARLGGRGGLRADDGGDRSRRVFSAVSAMGSAVSAMGSVEVRSHRLVGGPGKTWFAVAALVARVWLEGLHAPRLGDHGDATWCIDIGGCPYTTV